MGGGRKGKKKTKKKKTYTKAQQMAKKRIAAKKDAPKATKTKSTPASTGRAPTKTVTKAQQMAKNRIAAGKTISQVKADNKASMQKKAAERNTKFKQTGVQTLGGKKTTFTKAEQKKITDAGYKVSGYSKAPAQSNTQLQVNKDNQKYGNTFPSGAIGISEAGKAQAEANKAEAAAKRTAPVGGFNISEAGRKQAEANKAAAAAKAQAEAKAAAESRRLAAENARRIAAERAAAKAEADRVAAAKKAAEKAAAERARVEAARKAEAERKRKAEIARKAEEKRQRQFDPARLDPTATLKVNPLTDNTYFNLGRNIRIPNENTASFSKLFKDDLSQVTRTDKAFKEGATGVKGFRPLKAFTPDMLSTGPTPLVRQTAERFLPAGLRNISLASQIFNQGREDSGLTQSLNRVDNTNIGGLSIGFKSPESTDLGARASKFLSGAFDKVAGGLNIGASAQASEGGDAPTSNVGRALTFGKNLLKQPKAALAYGADVVSQAFAPRLADGTLTGNMDFAGNLPGDKGFDNRDVQIKSAFNNAMDSRFVQQAGENLGLPKNFKAQTKDALAALGENFKGATADRDGIYKGTSETLKNLSSDKRLAPIAKYLNQLGTDNENVTDADRNKKFSMMGFQTPFTNEQAADAITAFQPNVEKMTGLSTAERGRIEGGGGNRLLSGKLTDIAREAITGNIGTGESLGIPKGTPLTIGNMLDAGSKIATNLKSPDTLASKRSAEIKTLATGGRSGRDITPGSLLRGVNPFRGSNRGGGTTTAPRFQSVGGGGGRGTPVGQVPQIPATTTATGTVPQFQVPELPEFPIQRGTDAGNLANIQNESYQNTFRNLMAINPNYMARFQMRRRPGRRGSFKRAFSRRFFS